MADPTMLDWSNLIIRLVVGMFFFSCGFRKTFFKAAHNILKQYSLDLGLKNPAWPWVIAISELLGGIALIIGFLVPVASIGLIIIMVGAFRMKCWPNICRQNPKGPLEWWANICMEAEVLFMALLIHLVTTSAGAFSVDHYYNVFSIFG